MHDYPKTQELECLHKVTWSELVELEPGLGPLLWEARKAGAACREWSNTAQVFAPFRNALSKLVGFANVHGRHRVLGSLGAYEVAYWKLYDAIVGLLPRPDRGGSKQTSSVRAAPLTDGLAGMGTAEMANLSLR